MNSKRLKRANLSPGQRRVVDLALSGKNVFFTGAAGTGKSYLLRQLVCELEKQNQFHGRVFVTAPTGLAAWHLGGTTIHSFAGIKRSDPPLDDLLKEIYASEYSLQRWQYCKCLVIDEISMIDADFLNKLDAIGRYVRDSPDLPFGGMQLVFSGDFFQLPPVENSDDDIHILLHARAAAAASASTSSSSSSAAAALPPSPPPPLPAARYAFESDRWDDFFDVFVMLTTSFRHRETTFLKLLNAIRTGERCQQTVEKLLRGTRQNFDEERTPPTRLFSTNAMVDKENDIHLKELGDDVDIETYQAVDTSKGLVHISEKNCPVPQQLTLKVGASVMLLRNLDQSKGLVNGCMGTVTSFAHGSRYPNVLFAPKAGLTIMNKQQQTVIPVTWERKSGADVFATRTALPLRLSYAMTIHKSQGQTLPRVELNFKSRTFASGQAYSALSRATGFRGLVVKNLKKNDIRVSPKVVEWYTKVFGKVS